MEPKKVPKPIQKQKSYQQQPLKNLNQLSIKTSYGPNHQKSLTQSQTYLDKLLKHLLLRVDWKMLVEAAKPHNEGFCACAKGGNVPPYSCR
jgi:hypothetical protein